MAAASMQDHCQRIYTFRMQEPRHCRLPRIWPRLPDRPPLRGSQDTMTDNETTSGAPRSVAATPVVRARMPLAARRLILIGSLGVLAGVLAGRYYFGGLVLAAAAITLVALGLSYQAGTSWFSRLSWLVVAAGALWTMATAGYWWLINAAADASSGPAENASLLLFLGTGALVVMVSAVLSAAILRINRGRRTTQP